MKVIFNVILVLFFLIGAFSYRIPLPPAKNYESVIHAEGSNFLLSDTITGNIMWLDLSTNLVATIVRAPPNRVIQGVAFDKASGLLLAAGSGPAYAGILNGQLSETPNIGNLVYKTVPPAIHVYSFATGKGVVECPLPDGGVVNDIVIVGEGKFAYFTDSGRPLLYRLKLSSIPTCDISTISLPADQFSGNNFFSAGIAWFRGGLVIANFAFARIYFLDLATGKLSIVVDTGVVGGMDGIRISEGRCLFIASNDDKTVNVMKLTMNGRTRKVTAKLSRRIQDPDFTEITSVAIRGHTLVVTNNDMVELGTNGSLWATVVEIPKNTWWC